MANPFCPKCGSLDVTFRNKKQCYICDDCNTDFMPEKEFCPLRIFISYGHDDYATFAQSLSDDLKKNGHETWFDLERLKPGGDWENYIEEGLNWVTEKPGMGRIVFVMTPHSVRRPDGYCLNEIARALDHHLFIIPVMLVWCNPPLSISRIQWLDMQSCSKAPLQDECNTSIKNRLLDALENHNIAFEGQGSLLKNHLDPLSFEADVVHYQKWFVGREWVFDDINKWLDNPDAQRLYWVTGHPGIGKTAIATHLIHKMENLVAFHLCRRGNSEKSSPRRAVMSIAYQLSTQLPDYAEQLASINLTHLLSNPNVNSGALFDALIVQPLATDIKRPPTPRVILIDGLDEATNDGQNLLAGFIASEFKKLPDWLRIIITSRSEPEVTVPLQEWDKWELKAEDFRNKQDIELYVQKMLTAKFPQGVPSKILDAILQNSAGIFLYAEWVCLEIVSGRLSVESPQDFPQGLGGIYERYFRHKLTKENSYKADIERFGVTIRPVLELILAAREPLEMEQIAVWMGFRRYQTEAFIKDMGSLFFLDSNGCIRPFHSSVMEWLGKKTKAGDFFVDAKDGNEGLCKYLWQECKERTPDCYSIYALRHLPYHLIEEQRWDEVVELLGNLDFIQAKAAAKLTYGLVEDFNNALARIPDNAGNIRLEKERVARMQRYSMNLTAYARGETNTLEVPRSTATRIRVETQREAQRIASSPNRADILRDYVNFLGKEAANLQRFAPETPLFAYQQAWNYSSGGAVGNAASKAIVSDKMPLMLRASAFRPAYQPLPQTLKIFISHTVSVCSVSITPDAKRAVTGSADGLCLFWDMDSGGVLNTLKGHLGSVNSLSITPDATRAISASGDGSCILWDLESGKAIHTLRGHNELVNCVSITPDGKRAISGSLDLSCILWNLETGKAILTLTEHKCSVTSISITPDGKRAVSGYGDGVCILWNLETGKAISTHKEHSKVVTSVSITPDGKKAISGSCDQTCILWNLESGKATYTLKGHSERVNSVSISPDGRRAISGSSDNTCIHWNLEKCERILILRGHTDWVNSVSITPDGKRGFSGSWDNTCILWDLEGIEDNQTLHGHLDIVSSLCIAPDGKSVLSSSKDKTCIIRDLATGEVINTFKGHTKAVTAVTITPDWERALSGGGDGACILWDMQSGKAIRTYKGDTGLVTALCITADGKHAISGYKDGTCIIWDMVSGEAIRSIDNHTGPVTSLGITPDGKLGISGSADRTCILWNLESCKAIHILDRHIYPVNSVSITPNGKFAISGSVDRTCILWDMESGSPIYTLVGHSKGVNSVSVTLDGERAISCAGDGTCVFWDLESGDKIMQFPINTIPQSMALNTNFLFLGLISGEVIALKTDRGLLCPGTPIITARDIWDSRQHTYMPLSADCPLCGHRFAPDTTVIDTITRITQKAALKPEDSPCLSLPKECWVDPGLLSNCPNCGEKLKFNPFFPAHL